MVEAIVSVLLVGTLFVAVINTVGASKTSQYKRNERGKAHALAQSLIAEVTTQAYEEPVDTPNPNLGLELGEIDSNRANWDDVDDYDGWLSSPPQNEDQTTIPGFDGWTRSVEVVWVNPDDLSQTSASDTGAKRITVEVKRAGRIIASLVTIRTTGR